MNAGKQIKAIKARKKRRHLRNKGIKARWHVRDVSM